MNTQPHPYDRRHLKEVLHKNELIDNLVEARDWAKAHLEAVLIGLLVLAAAVFGVYYFVDNQRKAALDSAKKLSDAQHIFEQAGSLPPSETVQGFTQAFAKYQEVASSYEGSAEASAARLGMANCDLAMGKGTDAEREYAALDSRDVKSVIAALAGLGRARSLELQGKLQDAMKAYGDAARDYPGSAVEAEAKDSQERLGKLPPGVLNAAPNPGRAASGLGGAAPAGMPGLAQGGAAPAVLNSGAGPAAANPAPGAAAPVPAPVAPNPGKLPPVAPNPGAAPNAGNAAPAK